MKAGAQGASRLFCTLSVLFLLSAPAQVVDAAEVDRAVVRLEFDLKVPGVSPREGRLILRPSESSTTLPTPTGDSPFTLAFSPEKPDLTIELPPGSRWEVSGEIPGFWLRREQIVAVSGDNAPRQRLKVWPLGKITGSVQMASPKEKRPKEVVVTTLAPRLSKGPSDLPRGLLRCPVDSKGTWSCELPAATFDLAISAEGFIPHYLWEVAVPAAKARDLGASRFEKGSSVAGWIEVPGGGLKPESCTVRLAPLTAGGSLAETEKLRATAREVRPKDTGFFQLLGVEPGSYSLVIQNEGFAPARVAPVRVEREAESFVNQPIVLRRPLRIEVAVDPPLDWQERPWNVRVMRAGELGSALAYEALFEGTANPQGEVRIPAGGSGIFSIEVIDSTGQTLTAERDVRIDDEESARHVVSVRWIEVKGSLSRGKEPIAGTLWFGGEHGAVSVRMDADAEGHFGGILPKGADWVVEIAASDPSLRLVRRVEVKAGTDGKANLEIVVPDGRVFGRVLDDNDRPIEAANVLLSPRDEFSLSQSSTKQGSFDFQSVPTGPFEIGATLGKGEAFAEPVPLVLVDGELGPIDLHLRTGKSFEGKVVSNRGPVPGARVAVFPLVPPMGMTGDVRTNLEGAFHTNLPPSVQRVELVVSAPGTSLRAFDLPVGEPVTLRVTDDGGTVRVRVPRGAEKPRVLHFFQEGVEVPLFLLRSWARGQGALARPEGEEFPSLAPGEIQVCLDPPGGGDDPDKGLAEEKATCAQSVLNPGDVLELSP